VYLRDQTEDPIGLIVEETSDGPLRAVILDRRRQEWTFSPDVAAPIMFDVRNRRRWKLISRQEAWSVAQSLGATLPSESELHRICEAG
ncbi:MAG: hypothetical protein ACRDUA_07140, partial [Micromonosporaceae bacterium]